LAGPELPKVLVVFGATGVGKTETACLVAREIAGEIVSADSRQLYRRMDVGTGKPTPSELSAARHHLIDVLEPTERFDAARFSQEARRCFLEIAARGRIPMLVGGTGLYVKAALEGLFPAPGTDEELRRRLRAQEAESRGCLYERLKSVDPARADELSPRDLTRVIRALEVFELTGRPMSRIRAEWRPVRWPHLSFGLSRPREELYRRIDARVDAMARAGLREEVQGLLESGVPAGAPGLRTIGYRETVAHLAGELTLDQALALVKRNTRRYAKRQMTWFRRVPDSRWITLGGPHEAASLIVRNWRSAGP
jgi:tRNA dimethylallyltransferase